MDDAVHTLEGTRDNVPVADIADDQLGVFGKIIWPLAIAVDLLDQAVEHADLVAAPKKFAGNGSADEAGSAGY
jgi:hypothetical protein